jgi:hypothetical protein
MRLVAAFLLALLAGCVHAQSLPERAPQYLPTLAQRQAAIWPDAPIPSFLAGQVEQESCIFLTHPKCWNPTVQLKTSREWGRGLGQFTTAYNKDGSIRFDTQEELRVRYVSLRGWTTDKWADASYQLTALVEMDKALYRNLDGLAVDPIETLRFTLAAYNGGKGGLLKDRLLCRNTAGCDPRRWVGHVETTCTKAKVPAPGYRMSFCAINREYPHNIIDVRRSKYVRYFRD